MEEPAKSSGAPVEEINLWEYLGVVVKRRRMIVRNVLGAGLLTAVVSFFLPKTYTAVTTLLPPEGNEPSALSTFLNSTPLSNFLLAGGSSASAELFVEILKSRTVGLGVLERPYVIKGRRQTLRETFGTPSVEAGLRRLRQATSLSASEQGIVSIRVELRDPELAAQVARAYVEELDRVNKEKSASRAKSTRLYIENQLRLTEQKLKESSAALARFQEKHQAVSLEEQTKAAIEAAGEVKGKILAKEVELGVLLQSMKPSNPEVIRLQREIDEMKRQYASLQFGEAVPLEQPKDFFIPFAEVPEVGLELAKLLRETKVQETVWELLNQQYYQAKIQEARDTPTVQVLDEAVPPERRTSPKRALLVITMSVASLLVSIFWAFGQEYVDRLRVERVEEYKKVSGLLNEIRTDVSLLSNAFRAKLGGKLPKFKGR